jgi:diaminopimelate decarboxylase
MGHLMRPAVYGAYHGVYNLSNPEGPLKPYDVVGNVCEGGDVFARQRPVQQIREGDLLAVLDAGAYGMAMASTYNLRPLPAEVMIRPDGRLDLARRRRPPEELIDALLEAEATAATRSPTAPASPAAY